jgi:hypothetical protein
VGIGAAFSAHHVCASSLLHSQYSLSISIRGTKRDQGSAVYQIVQQLLAADDEQSAANYSARQTDGEEAEGEAAEGEAGKGEAGKGFDASMGGTSTGYCDGQWWDPQSIRVEDPLRSGSNLACPLSAASCLLIDYELQRAVGIVGAVEVTMDAIAEREHSQEQEHMQVQEQDKIGQKVQQEQGLVGMLLHGAEDEFVRSVLGDGSTGNARDRSTGNPLSTVPASITATMMTPQPAVCTVAPALSALNQLLDAVPRHTASQAAVHQAPQCQVRMQRFALLLCGGQLWIGQLIKICKRKRWFESFLSRADGQSTLHTRLYAVCAPAPGSVSKPAPGAGAAAGGWSVLPLPNDGASSAGVVSADVACNPTHFVSEIILKVDEEERLWLVGRALEMYQEMARTVQNFSKRVNGLEGGAIVAPEEGGADGKTEAQVGVGMSEVMAEVGLGLEMGEQATPQMVTQVAQQVQVRQWARRLQDWRARMRQLPVCNVCFERDRKQRDNKSQKERKLNDRKQALQSKLQAKRARLTGARSVSAAQTVANTESNGSVQGPGTSNASTTSTTRTTAAATATRARNRDCSGRDRDVDLGAAVDSRTSAGSDSIERPWGGAITANESYSRSTSNTVNADRYNQNGSDYHRAQQHGGYDNGDCAHSGKDKGSSQGRHAGYGHEDRHSRYGSDHDSRHRSSYNGRGYNSSHHDHGRSDHGNYRDSHDRDRSSYSEENGGSRDHQRPRDRWQSED